MPKGDKELLKADPEDGRRSYKYRRWLMQVIRQNGYCCASCGRGSLFNAEQVKLHVHHIKAFAQYPELRYEVSNGIILCEDCHKERHKKERTLDG